MILKTGFQSLFAIPCFPHCQASSQEVDPYLFQKAKTLLHTLGHDACQCLWRTAFGMKFGVDAEKTLTGREMAMSVFFDMNTVRKIWGDHQSGRKNYGSVLWAHYLFELWFQNAMRVLPGFQIRIAHLSSRPSLEEMSEDDVYKHFMLPCYQAEKQKSKQERKMREEAELIAGQERNKRKEAEMKAEQAEQKAEQERQRAEKSEQRAELLYARLKGLGID